MTYFKFQALCFFIVTINTVIFNDILLKTTCQLQISKTNLKNEGSFSPSYFIRLHSTDYI